jgi:competence protein ComEC
MTIFFTKYKIKKVFLTDDIKSQFEILQKKIISQHNNNFISEFYSAIFLATPISKEFRLQISKLGVSHLIALSGFHLSILWIFVYKLTAIPYKYAQKRYFPYRHSLLDIGSFTILTLGFYLWFVDMPPSLVRSYSMILFTWISTLLGIEIFSFSFLLIIVLGLVAIDISLFCSISFWLSVSGVFYIYLIDLHTKNIKNKILKYLIFPFGIFFLMLPVVHIIFDITSILQPFSILLSLIFVPFYPILIILHLIGYGYILDEYLLLLINISSKELSYLMPLTFDILLIYLVVSVVSIFSKNIFWFLVLIAISYAIYLF